MIKAVLFDVGGVLHNNENDVVMDAVQQGLNVTKAQLKEIWDGPVHLFSIGELDEAAVWRQIQQQYHTRLVSPDEHLFSKRFEHMLQPNDRMLEAARRFDRAGLITAVFSNSIAPHAAVLEAAGIYAPFAHRFLSHQLGMHKPDERMYKTILNTLRILPEESIFIDDLSENIAAARHLGMHGIVFKDTEQCLAELKALLPNIALE